mgnify:CR=1 FL=1
MKTRTKITVALTVGIGLLVSSMGTASASPHYTNWGGSGGFKAEVASVEAIKVAQTNLSQIAIVENSENATGFSHHANVDKFQQEGNLIENIRVTLKEKTSQVQLDVGPVNIEKSETSFEDLGNNSGNDHDMNDITVGVSDIWTTGGTSSVWTSGGVTSIWTNGGASTIWTSGGVTSIWTNGSGTRLYANFVPFSF